MTRFIRHFQNMKIV